MDLAVFVPFFLLGTFSGSFLNVLIYRISEELSVVLPRSFCPNCKTTIPFYRNVPLVSFILQFGKCHSCKEKISFQYPTVEFISGLIWVWSFSNFQWDFALFVSGLVSLLFVISWIDFKTMQIPLNLIIFCGVFVILGIILNILPIKDTILGIIIGPISFFIVLGVTFLISKRQSMGYGDIQLSAILGGWLGPINILIVFFLASLFSLVGWGILSFKSGFDKNRALPFAPFLVLSGVGLFVFEFYLESTLFEIIFF